MKAMIFAAGLGTRFKPWTDTHPKALAIINGKSLLQRNIEYLQQYGISDVVVNVHHFADQIMEAVEKNKGWGSSIIISDETNEVLETGGGLMKAEKYLTGDGPFITLNADILTDLNISQLLDFHHAQQALISFAISARKSSRNFLFNDKHQLRGWRNDVTGDEKGPFLAAPAAAEKLHKMAYSCVVVFEPEVFSLIRQTGKFSLTDTYLDLAATQKIRGFEHSGDKWIDVGKPESVVAAELMFGE